MFNTDTVNLFNTAITHNLNGIRMYGARNTKMEKMNFSYIMNLSLGVEIMHSINVHMSDIYGTSSDTFTFVRNCQIAEKGIRIHDGISIQECNNVDVLNLNFIYSSKLTLLTVYRSKNVYLRNITIHSSSNNELPHTNGIAINNSTNITGVYIHSHSNNNHMEIYMQHCMNTTILHAVLTSKK